jgi:hypothetical protein
VQAGVAAELAQIPLTPVSFALTHSDIFTAILTGQWLHFAYDATLVVQTAIDYDQPADVTAIVVHSFFSVTGDFPASFSETVSSSPPSTPASQVTSVGASIGAPLANLGAAIQSDVRWTLAALAAVVIVVVIVLGTGKNVPALVPRL